MASFMNRQVISAHFARIGIIGIPGQTTSKGTSGSTTLTKTRMILSSAMYSRNGPTGQAAAAGEEESGHKTIPWFYSLGRVFVLLHLHIPFAVAAVAVASADASSCQTGCIYAESAPGRAQGAVTAVVCFRAMGSSTFSFPPFFCSGLISFLF
jgi:hypothetical protein